MNGLDDLSRTLDERASGLVDHDLAARGASVHRRIVVARRRRRAAAATGLAAVVAVAAGVALTVPGHHADRGAQLATVVGVPAPDTMTSLGFTYRLDQTVDGADGRASVHLDASTEPRLVSWATSGDDQSVRVDGPSLGTPTRIDVPDFGDFTFVPPGDATTVTASVRSGDPGLAVYTLTDDRPAGVTKDGVTFRRQIAGGRLISAVVGDRGQDEVSVPATATGAGVAFYAWCTGGPRDAVLHVEYLDAKKGSYDAGGGGCADPAPVDAVERSFSSVATRAGEDVGVRLYATDGIGGPRISLAGLQLGLGVYGLDQNPTGPDEYTPDVLEQAGHVWRLVDVHTTAQDREVSATAPADQGPVLAVVFDRGGRTSHLMVQASLDGAAGTGMSGGGGAPQLMAAGGRATVQVTDGDFVPGQEVGVAFYVEDH